MNVKELSDWLQKQPGDFEVLFWNAESEDFYSAEWSEIMLKKQIINEEEL